MPWKRAGAEPPEWMEHLPPLPQLGPYVVIARVGLPFAIYGLLILLVHLIAPHLLGETLGRTLGVFILGKLSATGGQAEFLYWVFMIGTVDVLVGLFLVWNFDVLYRIPGMGPMLHALEARGSLFLQENDWVRRVAFIGVVLVVMVPFQGTGAVMGSIIGRLVGLGPWRALAAIAIGGYSGVALILSASWLIAILSGVSPAAAAGTLAVLILVGLLVWRRWFRRRRRAQEEATAAPETTAEATAAASEK